MKKYLLLGAIILLPACTLPQTKEVTKRPHKYTCEEILASAERLRARGIDIRIDMQCLGSKRRGYPVR